MLEIRMLGAFALIPTLILLTISFFVLVIANKLNENGLKSFGRIIAMLLWVAATLVVVCGIVMMATGYCPMTRIMKKCAIKKMHYKKMMYGDKCESMKSGSYHKGMKRK